MRKEYSDLPDYQKLIYIKRAVVMGVCYFIPMVFFLGALFSLMGYYQPLFDHEILETVRANSTSTPKQVEQAELSVEFFAILTALLTIGGIIGFSMLGFCLGDWAVTKLRLYTDFQLESAGRRFAEIKKVLDKEQDTKSEFGKA